MKTLVSTVAGALALGAVLVAYDLGQHRTFTQDAAAMSIGYQQGQPNFVPAGQAGYVSPYAPYATPFAAQSSYGMAPMAGSPAPQYAAQRLVTSQPAAPRAAYQRAYASERVSTPQRTWQKSALLIGGSAAGGAGVGALIGGKKGAGIGALLGGGTAAIYDQVKRH